MTQIPCRRICDNQYEFPSHRDVSLNACKLVQQILTPNPQEHPSLHDIVDHAFFTSGIVSGFISISAQEIPSNFCHISPLISRANFSRLRQACQLDGGDPTASPENIDPPAPSASSASSLAQQEHKFQKAVSTTWQSDLRVAQLCAAAAHGCAGRYHRHRSRRTNIPVQTAGREEGSRHDQVAS